MIKTLSVQMLTKNNSKTIDHVLRSLHDLPCQFVICDLGSSDDTIEKILPYDPKIIKFSAGDDLSLARNAMIPHGKDKWIMYIEPYESLISGIDQIKSAIKGSPSAYNFGVIEGDTLTRQIRLWHSSIPYKFTNPVFETIEGDSKFLNAFISVLSHKNEIKVHEILHNWQKKSPLKPDPFYYLACHELAEKNWNSFINYAEMYIYQQKRQTMSLYMTHYYLGMVHCYVKKNLNKSLEHSYYCLMKNPMMAEFWCLLGDVFYQARKYDKAYHFYENAILMGSRRLQLCDWPMEISKYKEYPSKMMESCKKLLSETRVFFLESEQSV